MSDSSIALKPVIDEPSKPMPSSSAPSTSLRVIEKLFRCPSRSVNQRRMSSIPADSISASTSLRVSGSDVARFLLSTYAILPPEMRKAPAATLCGNRGSVASQSSVAVYSPIGRSGRPLAEAHWYGSESHVHRLMRRTVVFVAALVAAVAFASAPQAARTKVYVAPAGSGAL